MKHDKHILMNFPQILNISYEILTMIECLIFKDQDIWEQIFFIKATLVAQTIKTLPAVLGWEDSPGEGNGNSLQYSCLENSIDKGAWWATVLGVTKSWNDWATNTPTHFLLPLWGQDHGFWAHQFSSVAQSCPTLREPMNHSTLGLPVHHQFPESTQTHVHWVGDTIQPSHLLSSPSLPAFNLSQNQGLCQWINSSHQVPKVLEF